MTDEMRARLANWTAAIADRDQAILEAYAQGFSLREIAEAAGLSHTGVRKILQTKAETP